MLNTTGRKKHLNRSEITFQGHWKEIKIQIFVLNCISLKVEPYVFGSHQNKSQTKCLSPHLNKLMMSKTRLCSRKVNMGMDMSKAIQVRLNTSSNSLLWSERRHVYSKIKVGNPKYLKPSPLLYSTWKSLLFHCKFPQNW